MTATARAAVSGLLRRLAWWYLLRDQRSEFPGEVDVFATYYVDNYAAPRQKA